MHPLALSFLTPLGKQGAVAELLGVRQSPVAAALVRVNAGVVALVGTLPVGAALLTGLTSPPAVADAERLKRFKAPIVRVYVSKANPGLSTYYLLSFWLRRIELR